jgi:trk system potassium uptake protein TrkA
MHIIILGATPVGASLAANLVVENHSITVVDPEEDRLQELQEQYDLRTIYGHCAHPSILAQAGAGEADMILAVTESDETNIVACFVAMKVFKVPLKIARVTSADYFINSEHFFAGEPLIFLLIPAV